MKSIVAWFVDNSIAANLLTALLVLGGVVTMLSIRQEEFPSIDSEIVRVSVPYLGATPEEVEGSVCVRIEEAIAGTPGIDRSNATASEGSCTLLIELVEGSDRSTVVGEIESRVGGISTFPAETEKPVVSYLVITQDVIKIAISGAADETTLKVLAQGMHDDLVLLPNVSQVDVAYTRPYEISIEVSEQTLRQYGLTFDQVVDAVRSSSLDMPGGSVKTEGGEILLRSEGQAYGRDDFSEIVVVTRTDGSTVTLGQIADIVDGFRDDDVRAYFDGQPAVVVQVNRVGEESIIDIARVVHTYIENARLEMPEGISLTTWNDEAASLRGRINALVGNAAGGLVCVLIVLALVLRFRLALWVAAGIPIALLGALMLFPVFDFSISTIAVMGFILVLGIVVDDAIVVGERVFAFEQDGYAPREAAARGTVDVLVPVVFGVLTTVVAFAPLVFVPGRMGQFFGVLGGTVILCLILSLVEALLILPAHLAHRHRDGSDARQGDGPAEGGWQRMQDKVSGTLDAFVRDRYQPALERVLEWRYLAMSIAVGILMITLALFLSGRIEFQFFPGIEGNRIYATLTMPQGTPLERTEAAVVQLEQAAVAVENEYQREYDTEGRLVVHTLSSIGRQAPRGGPSAISSGGGTHLAQLRLELTDWQERELTASQIGARWRDAVGGIPDAVELKFEAYSMHAGSPIGLVLSSEDPRDLVRASEDLRGALSEYDGVMDVSDSFRTGKEEIRLRLRPEAEPLGITLSDLARQVRTAFYGAEVQRIQRGRDDVRVMVRYPAEERRSLGNLESMWIRAPDGTEIPFAAIAEAVPGRGFATIERIDGRPVVTVTADVDRNVTSPEEVMADLRANVLPRLQERYRGLYYGLEGEQRERTKAMSGLARAFLFAMLIIYALLAIPLKSYAQPFVIMLAIPFGAVGAVLGHAIMGWDLVFFSILGIVALAGVVVNDSLVLVDFANREVARGLSIEEATRIAGAKRFRAIFLTSVTTFAGLAPLMVNVSEATFFVVPIAISLAFGVLVATAITLFLVPSGLLIVNDLNGWRRALRQPRSRVDSTTSSTST